LSAQADEPDKGEDLPTLQASSGALEQHDLLSPNRADRLDEAAAESKSSPGVPFQPGLRRVGSARDASLDFGHEAQHSCIYDSHEQQIGIFALA
jgi:hypothetical protein